MEKIEIVKPVMEHSSVESFKTLRTNLLFCGEDKKVIVFTSCTENEGKTQIALNLGIAMAEAKKKVLLVDADLRKSVLAGRVKVNTQIKGLTHFLSHQEELSDIIYTTNIPYFNMIFSGPVPPNPAELLSSNYFARMLAALRESCDYILIDSPPLGSVIDAAIIAKECDGAILVIESGWNSRRFELGVKDQLEKAGCPILGAVLNKVDKKVQSYGKYGKYGKYGTYGEKK